MASSPRAAAQRATAARVRANRDRTAGERTPILPKSITSRARAANRSYADQVIGGTEDRPAYGSAEAKNLGRLAALANIGKADPKYLAFKDYWYHSRE